VTYFQGHPVKQAIYNGEPVEYVADQLVVKLKNHLANDPRIQRLVFDSLPPHSTFEQGFNRGGHAVIHLPEGVDPLHVAENLSRRDEVEFAEPSFLHTGD